MGTTCDLKWREADEKERLWVVDPSHPITEGIGEYIELEKEEMYGEHFDIPAPDELVFVSWFEGGEVFRSGATFKRGKGKIFYFRPGHETYPTYHNEDIQTVIRNAVKWAGNTNTPTPIYGNAKPLEKIANYNDDMRGVNEMTKLRVAVIGCGSIAKYRHLGEYHNNRLSKLLRYVTLSKNESKKWQAIRCKSLYKL